MELINVKTEKDLLNLLDVLQKGGLGVEEHLWTSGTDLGSNGNFYWSSTAEEFTSAVPWFVYPKIEESNEHCVELVNGTYLKDSICDQTFHYLCYRIESTTDFKDSYFEIVKNNTKFSIFYEKVITTF